MGLVQESDGQWFEEKLFGDVRQKIKVKAVLVRKVTRDKKGKKLHELLLVDTFRYGKMLTLNNAIQVTETPEDESAYQEMLVHYAVNACIEEPKTILLIGCDGGTLREAVKYRCLQKIWVVDIDRTVRDLVEKHMPSIPNGAWSDPRVSFFARDGAEFLEKAALGVRFDVVIIDSPDPIGCAQSLFKTSFYTNVAKRVSPRGVVMRQTGSSVLQPDESPDNVIQMQEIFPNGDVQVVLTSVATYIGGPFTFVAASHEKELFGRSLKGLESRFRRRIKPEAMASLQWYSPEMHRASMVLPPWLERMIGTREYGRELIIDLFRCNYDIISSRERLAEFAKKICEVIKMKPFGEPLIPNFGHAKLKTAGPSLVQLIETSAVTGHYTPHWRMSLKNIFTCAALEVATAVEFMMNFFEAEEAQWTVRIRGKRMRTRDKARHEYKTVRTGGSFVTVRDVYQYNRTETVDLAKVTF